VPSRNPRNATPKNFRELNRRALLHFHIRTQEIIVGNQMLAPVNDLPADVLDKSG